MIFSCSPSPERRRGEYAKLTRWLICAVRVMIFVIAYLRSKVQVFFFSRKRSSGLCMKRGVVPTLNTRVLRPYRHHIVDPGL